MKSTVAAFLHLRTGDERSPLRELSSGDLLSSGGSDPDGAELYPAWPELPLWWNMPIRKLLSGLLERDAVPGGRHHRRLSRKPALRESWLLLSCFRSSAVVMRPLPSVVHRSMAMNPNTRRRESTRQSRANGQRRAAVQTGQPGARWAARPWNRFHVHPAPHPAQAPTQGPNQVQPAQADLVSIHPPHVRQPVRLGRWLHRAAIQSHGSRQRHHDRTLQPPSPRSLQRKSIRGGHRGSFQTRGERGIPVSFLPK